MSYVTPAAERATFVFLNTCGSETRDDANAQDGAYVLLAEQRGASMIEGVDL